MRRYTVGLLIALTALPALAATGVSRLIPGENKSSSATENVAVNTTARATPETEKRATGSRENAGYTPGTKDRTAKSPSRVVVATSTKDSTRTNAKTTGTSSTRSTNRAVAASRAQNSDSSRAKLDAAVHTVGRSSRTEAASINNNPAVRRQGLVLRPSTAEVGGRAIIAGTGKQTGSNMDKEIRNVSSRAASKTTQLDAETISRAKDALEQSVALNKTCQEQYNDCMDQFCAVVDANQKRCSCSSNLSKYSKVEAAVKEANVQLNEVAQNIRYVGLSADEIRAIMNETEAEEALSKNKDTSDSRKMLTQIEKMIKDPTTTGTSSSSDSFGTLDLDLDFSADDGDMFDLSFLGSNDKGFSSLRGTELYKAAKKRCATVLNQCKDVGANQDQITGNYDLAIDKDCVAYEQGLTKMNDTLLSNVRSANRMLQKARLSVLQDHNSYDARGCVSALETCMTDEMVCGADYKKCLDPTKTMIDENGTVVLGQNIGKIHEFLTAYNNAAINRTTLGDAYQVTITTNYCKADGNDGRCIMKYLLDKIGTKQKATDEGLCRPVLDKCRAYSYDSNGNYVAYNDIVVNYIQRAMVNIKGGQSKIVSDYASTCLNDVADCYNQQVNQINNWAENASAASVRNVMSGACRNVALTCAYAVFYGNNVSACDTDEHCITNLSDMFYQSLLCPDNSTYDTSGESPHTVDPDNTQNGWANPLCQCNVGYSSYQGQCISTCPSHAIYVSSSHSVDEGTQNGYVSANCQCVSGYYAYSSINTCSSSIIRTSAATQAPAAEESIHTGGE